MQLVELTGAGAGGKGIVWSVLWEVDPSSPTASGSSASGNVAKELFPTDSPTMQQQQPLASVSQSMDCSQCFTACALDITGTHNCAQGADSNPPISVLAIEQLPSRACGGLAGSGEEVAALCSWNGLTHFIDSKGQTISFHSHQPVRAFTAGKWASCCSIRYHSHVSHSLVVARCLTSPSRARQECTQSNPARSRLAWSTSPSRYAATHTHTHTHTHNESRL
jgi:hypothetical protein